MQPFPSIIVPNVSNSFQEPSWLPVDHVAATILDLSLLSLSSASVSTGPRPLSKSQPTTATFIYNIVNPQTFSWTCHLLPMLQRNCGLTFKIVPPSEWVQHLRNSNPDPERNPTRKLVSFFAEKYEGEGRIAMKGLNFVTKKTEEDSLTMGRRVGVDVIKEGGIMEMTVERWLKQWKGYET